MSRATSLRLLVVVLSVCAIGVLVGLYVSDVVGTATPYRVPVANAAGEKSVNLTLQTVAAVGPVLSPNENWVSYLTLENGTWRRDTEWDLPANALVHVTVYQYDGQSGLRNPFLAQARGLVGNSFAVNGKPMTVIDPTAASHTFAIPALGVIVPLIGIADDAPDQCDYAPCAQSAAHNTITFTFRTGAPGRFRWQCFVPCAAGFLAGFGGPMQTLGYMDGFINVA